MKSPILKIFFVLALVNISCGERSPAEPAAPEIKESKTGLASFYTRHSAGPITAEGEKFDDTQMMAAHPTYPFGTRVRVTNLEKGGVIEVSIADRGPSAENREEGVIIDLYSAAAKKLGITEDGRVRVQVDVLEWGVEEKKDSSASKP